MEIFLAVAAGIILGAVCGYLAARVKSASLAALLESKSAENQALASDKTASDARAEALQRELADVRAEATALQREVKILNEQKQREEEQRRKEFDAHLEAVKENLQKTAYEMLERKAQTLGEKNTESMDAILKPYREGLEAMRKAVESARDNSNRNTASLEKMIEEMMKRAAEMGEEAERLARALKNETKVQGNWGEVILDTLLVRSGLTEGVHYERQATVRDSQGRTVFNEETGKRMIPDVVIHFPDGKDVVVDSKVSLTAFVDYLNAGSDEERASALKRHIESVRRHVDELARKDYASYIREGRSKVDYMMMFIPNDSAMQLAVLNDRDLWQRAFDKGIFITSEQNLMLALRLIYGAWSQVAQCQNQEEVFKVAGMLLERVVDFADMFSGVGERLDGTRKLYAEAYGKLRDGRQSIYGAAKRLSEMGAKVKSSKQKKMQLLEGDDDDPEVAEALPEPSPTSGESAVSLASEH